MLPNERLLTAEDIAARLQVEPSTVREWARGGLIPPPLKLTARSLRWDREVLVTWLRGRIGAADIQCFSTGSTTDTEDRP